MGPIHIRIGSINLNKRISRDRWQAQLIRWLGNQGIDLLLTQEPAVSQELIPERLAGCQAVGGNDRVHAWREERAGPPLAMAVGPFWQRLDLGGVQIWNLYLDASSTRARGLQLTELIRLLEPLASRPHLVVGDFNIAPTPEDGLYDGRASTFNSRTDRGALAALMERMQLVDLRSKPARQEFTVERLQRGKLLQFRCDLALVSERLASHVTLAYDHGVRDPGGGFTDHSALVLDLSLPSIT